MTDLLTTLEAFGAPVASLAIIMPFFGSLIRLRANFIPKATVHLDVEGNIVRNTRRDAASLFDILARVKIIEGWGGLYKGFVPMLLQTCLSMLFIFVALWPTAIRYDGGILETGWLNRLAYLAISLLLGVPAAVLSYRSVAVTTPYRLSFFRPIRAFRVLLTRTERRRPWMIYATPGLFAALLFRMAYITLFLDWLKALLVPGSTGAKFGNIQIIYINSGTVRPMVAVLLFSTIIVCPLEVVAVKLAIQRNHAAPEYNSISQEPEIEEDSAASGEYIEYSDEDVIHLRHDSGYPYLGLNDCVNRVIREEGWGALFRGWWCTALTLLFVG
ncbi:mitochondrial carrier [Irpex rosettiformis]|uniref:Mitochondrial carrier n=1 Tax=Irpex rosettiformis TaxID=378272 RepID=A0ACB8TW50_9APHY|nr:mitochondrial carrier [Irpex rosettiformis]